MNLHQEHHFEREICAHLAANGWLYAEGDAEHYDLARVILAVLSFALPRLGPDVVGWLCRLLMGLGRWLR
ncbi:MAG: hypothetical protein ACRER5_03695 [Pseudomonas sp.]